MTENQDISSVDLLYKLFEILSQTADYWFNYF